MCSVGQGDSLAGIILLEVQEEGAQALPLAGGAGDKLGALAALALLGKHAELAGADVQLVGVLGVHKRRGLALALRHTRNTTSLIPHAKHMCEQGRRHSHRATSLCSSTRERCYCHV